MTQQEAELAASKINLKNKKLKVEFLTYRVIDVLPVLQGAEWKVALHCREINPDEKFKYDHVTTLFYEDITSVPHEIL